MAEENKLNIELLSDFYAVDRLFVEGKDPNYAYRWVRDHNINISIKTSNDPFLGFWKICQPEDLDRMNISKDLRSADGLLRRGDLILAQQPKEVYEKKETYRKKRAQAPVTQAIENLTKGDPSKGIVTAKELGMKS